VKNYRGMSEAELEKLAAGDPYAGVDYCLSRRELERRAFRRLQRDGYFEAGLSELGAIAKGEQR
jgi:hypothetical protein